MGFRWNFDRQLLFAPDSKDGTPSPEGTNDTPATGDAPGTNSGNNGGDDKKFTQAELDRIVQERLDRDRKKREAEAEKTRQEAEREALKQKEEYKALTETQEKELGELRPKAERYDTLAELVTKQLRDEVDAWPEEVKNLLPDSEPVEVLTFLQAVEKARPLAKRLTAEPAPPGNPRGPKPKGVPGRNQEITPVVDVLRTF